MQIVRDRFLDETRQLHLSLELRSRTTQAHSLLTGLSPSQREQVSSALVRALDEVERAIASRGAGSSDPA